MRIVSLRTLHFWIVTMRCDFRNYFAITNAKNPVYYSNLFFSLLQEYDYIYYHNINIWSMKNCKIHVFIREKPQIFPYSTDIHLSGLKEMNLFRRSPFIEPESLEIWIKK